MLLECLNRIGIKAIDDNERCWRRWWKANKTKCRWKSCKLLKRHSIMSIKCQFVANFCLSSSRKHQKPSSRKMLFNDDDRPDLKLRFNYPSIFEISTSSEWVREEIDENSYEMYEMFNIPARYMKADLQAVFFLFTFREIKMPRFMHNKHTWSILGTRPNIKRSTCASHKKKSNLQRKFACCVRCVTLIDIKMIVNWLEKFD